MIQEHRYYWDEYPQPSPGKLSQLDINQDFEEIVLSPMMENHVSDAIEQVIKQAGVSITVRRSTLLNHPMW